MAQFCTNCGKQLPENGVCDCQSQPQAATQPQAAAPAQSAAPAQGGALGQETSAATAASFAASSAASADAASSAASSSSDAAAGNQANPEQPGSAAAPPPAFAGDAPAQPGSAASAQANQAVDAFVKKSSVVLGDAWGYCLAFVKNPVATLRERALSTSSALFFVLVQPLFLFLLELAAFNKLFGGVNRLYGGSLVKFQGFSVFLNTYVGGLVAFAVFYAVAVLFGKVIFKKTLDVMKLFKLSAAAHIPLTLAYVVAILFVFAAPQLAAFALLIGLFATALLLAHAVSDAFELSANQALYTVALAFGLEAAGIVYIIYNNILSSLLSGVGSLFG